jgi:hypothetical protein
MAQMFIAKQRDRQIFKAKQNQQQKVTQHPSDPSLVEPGSLATLLDLIVDAIILSFPGFILNQTRQREGRSWKINVRASTLQCFG